MEEAGGMVAFQHLETDERGGQTSRPLHLDARNRRRVTELAFGPENSQRLREAERLRINLPYPRGHLPGDAFTTPGHELTRVEFSEDAPLELDPPQQLAEIEGVAPARLLEGGAQLVARVSTDPSHDRSDGCLAQDPRANDRSRFRAISQQRRLPRSRLGRTQREQ